MNNNNRNYDNKNTYNKKRAERPKNPEVECNLWFAPSVNGGQGYSDESIVDGLAHLNEQILPYINIGVTMDRATLLNDPEKKGVANIGYIKSYNENNNTITVGFFHKNAEFVKSINESNDKCLTVKINCIAKDDAFVKFTSFEVIVDSLE